MRYRTSFNLLSALLGVGLLIAPGPASADTTPEFEPGWQLRFYVAAVDLDHSSSGLTRPAGTSRIGTDAGGGVGVNGEYRFSRRLGIDLGLFTGGSVDVEASAYRVGGTSRVAYDSLTFTPLTVGLDVHLTPASRVDVYVAPLIALIQYGELRTTAGPHGAGTEIDFDEDIAPGLSLGLGVPFGKKGWSFQAHITYLDSSLEGQGVDGLRVSSGYDSTIFGIGAGYRF